LQIISHIVLIGAQSYILIQNFTKLLYFGQKNNDTVGTIPKSNIKIDTPNTQIYDHSLFWLGTGTSKDQKILHICNAYTLNLI